MDNALFYDSFHFLRCEARMNHCFDNRSGTKCHFLARIRNGRVRIVCENGEVIEVSTGEVFYLPMGLRYRSYWEKNEGDEVICWDSCGFVYFPEADVPSYPVQKLEGTSEENQTLDALCDSGVINTQSVGKFYLTLATILERMQRGEQDPRVLLRERIFEFIRQNPSFKVSALARECCMSESTLFLYFKNYLHTTPVALKWHILAQRAETMLICTDATVEEIALELGFESCAHFRKIFKAQRGMTPSELRRKNKRKNGL